MRATSPSSSVVSAAADVWTLRSSQTPCTISNFDRGIGHSSSSKSSASGGSSSGSTASRQSTRYLTKAQALFAANAGQLPPDNTRPPEIFQVGPSDLSASIVTTDFFGFDTTDNHYHLWGLGDASEMGDAVLGMVAHELGPHAPPWLAVRNVSDPEIDATGSTLREGSGAGGNHLQSVRALEHSVQRHRLLGPDRRAPDLR